MFQLPVSLSESESDCVSEPSLPVACPFRDAYHFSYNNNTGGVCATPQSYAHACASDAEFHFRFNECADAAYTHSLGEYGGCWAGLPNHHVVN